jgi:hypothetical protein
VSRRLPRIFIASSSERLSIAYTIQELLEFDGEVTVWTEGTFKPSSYTLDDLLNAVRSHQFGVFVFVPDDRITIRERNIPAVRDNLIFEFGLFAGAHGRQHCFFVLSRGTEATHLPTDLAGLTPLSYATGRTDDNLLAALGPACNQIRRAISERPSPAALTSTDAIHYDMPVAQDYIDAWESPELNEGRAIIRQSSLDPFDPDAAKALAVLRQLFVLFESMANAIISDRVEESILRPKFAQPVRALWPHIYVSLAPPSHADEWWDPLPKLAELYARWTPEPPMIN